MGISKKFGIAVMQWADSKVVNCVSSYLNLEELTIVRQIGRDKLQFPCPAALVHYQRNMGGVDRIDQMRSHGGGLASVSHFKKWYKKALMAVIDCQLLNGLHLWNATAEKIAGRVKLKRAKYLRLISDFLLTYETKTFMSPSRPAGQNRVARFAASPVDEALTEEAPTRTIDTGKEMGPAHKKDRCLVCSLEGSYYKKLWTNHKRMDETGAAQEANCVLKKRVQIGVSGMRRAVAACRICDVKAHGTVLDEDNNKVIHGFFPPNLSCMDILHSPLGKEIWSIKRDGLGKVIARVKTGHKVVKDLYKLVETDLGV